jgi:hypothetical protein
MWQGESQEIMQKGGITQMNCIKENHSMGVWDVYHEGWVTLTILNGRASISTSAQPPVYLLLR